jgi:hypothetical protein
MDLSRRNFHSVFGIAGVTGLRSFASLAPNAEGIQQEPPRDAKTAPYLFQDRTFENIFLTSLGRAYHSGANAGKVLYLTRQVKDGDFETAFAAFKEAGDEARAQAEESMAGGHRRLFSFAESRL